MKLTLGRRSLELEPENLLEVAFLEDTLNLNKPNALLRVGGRTSYGDGRRTISLEAWNSTPTEGKPEQPEKSPEPF